MNGESQAAWGTRTLGVVAVAALSACSARSSLGSDGPEDGGGGASSVDVAATSVTSSTAVGSGGGASCFPDDTSSWTLERYRDFGDYERAAVATSGVPWVALKVRGGNIVFEKVGVDDVAGIVVLESFELPDSPVYPVAFDVSDTRFVVLTTTGINWNGDVALWSVERATGAVTQVAVGDPPADPAYTVGSALGLVGDDVALAYSRLIDDHGVVELRDAALQVLASRTVDGVSFDGVHVAPGAFDVYVGASARLHVEGGAITDASVDPSWPVLGGLEDTLVQYDATIRMVRGDQSWEGPWPHTQISPPAVVRTHGGTSVFSLETELTAVLGYPSGGELAWMPIEPAPDAPGFGVGLLPVLEDGRMGLFYLGLEIPMPEQPLRYFGRRCR